MNISDFLHNLLLDLNTILQGLKSNMKDKAVVERVTKEKQALRQFQKGDLVLRKTPGLNSALETSWEGPFCIAEKLGDVNYSITHAEGRKSKPKAVHLNQLKKFVQALPCHKVLTVVDFESVDQPDGPFLPDHFKGPNLPESQKADLDSCFSKYSSVFSDTPGNTTSAYHSIKVTSDIPIWSPSYTLPIHVERKFKEELDSLLQQGIIERSASDWCSPPIPVIKKDGSIRIVVDFRKINSVTIVEPFYMPSTEEVIARLGSASFLSKVDLAKGFHQVPMAED